VGKFLIFDVSVQLWIFFREILQKNTELQLRFFQSRKEIFDFSGKFSESENDCLSLGLQSFFSNLIASRRKIAPKQWGFLELAQKYFAFFMISSWRQYGRFPTFNIVN
jgi:hypothetical protein